MNPEARTGRTTSPQSPRLRALPCAIVISVTLPFPSLAQAPRAHGSCQAGGFFDEQWVQYAGCTAMGFEPRFWWGVGSLKSL